MRPVVFRNRSWFLKLILHILNLIEYAEMRGGFILPIAHRFDAKPVIRNADEERIKEFRDERSESRK